MERSKAGTKERRTDGLTLPNQNTIKINIIRLYFKRYGKSPMKFKYKKRNGLVQYKNEKSSTLPGNLRPISKDHLVREKNPVQFSMAIGNVELLHERFPKYSRIGTARIRQRHRKRRQAKKSLH